MINIHGWMKTWVKIRKINGKYILVLPNFLINKTGLEDGSVLTVNINENAINITNTDNEQSTLPDIIEKNVEKSTLPDTTEENVDVFSKVLKEEELFLAK